MPSETVCTSRSLPDGATGVCDLLGAIQISLDEMLEAIDSSIEHLRAGDWGFDVLSDHTKPGKPIETHEARKLAEPVETLRMHFAYSRWAVVTKMAASFGMMRMLSVFLESIPMTQRVFDSDVEAERWPCSPRAANRQSSGAQSDEPPVRLGQ